MTKIRVGAVSYLNTRPLIYGIKNHPVFHDIELVEDYPSRLAQMLIEDRIDVGLIPVAATVNLKNWNIITDVCIGSDGPVASVAIFSEEPLERIEKIYLDYQSGTSVNLARVLLKEYWKKDIEFIHASGEDFRDKIKGTAAGVVIGDRALEQRLRSKYTYDLGEAWKQHTGLPFVFAAWIANKELRAEFKTAFNEANLSGLRNIDKVVKENSYALFDLKGYYSNFVRYDLDDEKRRGMALFLEKIKHPFPHY